jgi:hypothetical protein
MREAALISVAAAEMLDNITIDLLEDWQRWPTWVAVAVQWKMLGPVVFTRRWNTMVGILRGIGINIGKSGHGQKDS